MKIMNKSTLFYLIILSAISWSCNNSNNAIESDLVTDKLAIYVDSVSSNYNQLYQVIKDKNKEYMLVMNPFVNGVDIYDLDKRKIYRRVTIPTAGPNSIEKIDGFYAFTIDSILIMPEKRLDGLIVSRNSTERLKDIFEIKNPYFNHHVSSMTPILFHEKKMYLYNLLLRGQEKDSLDKMRLDLIIDFEKKDMKYLYNLEKETVDKAYADLRFPTRDLNDQGELVYSFPFDDNLMIYHINKDSFYYKPAKSQLMSGSTSKFVNTRSFTEQRLENNYYDGIKFDKVNQVYYRFCKLFTNAIGPRGEKRTAFHQKTSVLVLNKDFEVLDELELKPTHKWLTKDHVLLDEGMAISESNYLNEEMSEDSIVFTIIKEASWQKD